MVTFEEEFARALADDEEEAIEWYATMAACALSVEGADVDAFIETVRENHAAIDDADNPFRKKDELLGVK